MSSVACLACGDLHEPFLQRRQADDLGLQRLHLLRLQPHPRGVGRLHHADHRVLPLPGHRPGEAHHRLDRVQQRPVPVHLQHAPAPLDRVVLAVVRRVVRQLHHQAVLPGELHDPLEELGPAAVVLRAVVQVDHQRLDPQEPQPDLLPPLLQAIHDEVAGDLRAGHVQPQVVVLGQEDPEGRQRRLGLEVVVRRLGPGAAPAPA